MKNLLFLVLLIVGFQGYSQKKTTCYLELKGRVIFYSSYIHLQDVENSVKRTKADSLINYAEINRIVSENREPVKAINKLSEIGWTLVSVVPVVSNEQGLNNRTFVIYYLKRDFEQSEQH